MAAHDLWIPSVFDCEVACASVERVTVRLVPSSIKHVFEHSPIIRVDCSDPGFIVSLFDGAGQYLAK